MIDMVYLTNDKNKSDIVGRLSSDRHILKMLNQNIQQGTALQQAHQALHQTVPKTDLQEKERLKRRIISRRSKRKTQLTMRN